LPGFIWLAGLPQLDCRTPPPSGALYGEDFSRSFPN